MEERKAIFFSFIFTALHLHKLFTLVAHNKPLTQPFYTFLLTADFTFHICLVDISYNSHISDVMTWTLVFFGTDLLILSEQCNCGRSEEDIKSLLYRMKNFPYFFLRRVKNNIYDDSFF